jgi:hypothetical protein
MNGDMKEHRRLLTRAWILPVGAVVLIAGHVMLPYLLSRAGLTTAVVSGVVVLVVCKHLGLFGLLYGLLRRRPRRSTRGNGNSAVRSPDPK